MMDHLDTYITVDNEYGNELYMRWLDSNSNISYIYWLKRLVMHYAVGGASNEDVDTLKKTIMILINEIENGK